MSTIHHCYKGKRQAAERGAGKKRTERQGVVSREAGREYVFLTYIQHKRSNDRFGFNVRLRQFRRKRQMCEKEHFIMERLRLRLIFLYLCFAKIGCVSTKAVKQVCRFCIRLSLSLSAGALKIGCIPAVLYDTTAVGHYNIFTVSCHYAKAYARHSKYVVMQN